MKHYTITDLSDDVECPIIGTIINVTNSKQGTNRFIERLQKSLENFYDADVRLGDVPELHTGAQWDDMSVHVAVPSHPDRNIYKIRITETWIY